MNSQMGWTDTTTDYNTGWQHYRKISELRKLPPDRAFIFLDEHPGSINDGWFQVKMDPAGFPDVPASYHNNAAGFSFAEGHCEIRKWRNPDTIRPVVAGVVVQDITTSATSVDWIWLTQHSCTQ